MNLTRFDVAMVSLIVVPGIIVISAIIFLSALAINLLN